MNRRSAAALALSALMLCACLSAATAAHAHAAHAPAPAQGRAKARAAALYECPMHPEVNSGRRGRCPKCGMSLTPARAGAAQAADAPAVGESKKTEAVEPLRVPEATVYDQDGRELNFYRDLVKGKTVAINFIFTTCTTVCPPLSATFRKVQKDLGERVGRDVELISISVDPTTDTPERLKGFSAKFGAGAGWTFVTGKKPEINRLLSALGAYTGDKVNHTPMILIGDDASGRWTRTYGLSPASSIVGLIKEASAKGGPGASAQNAGEAGGVQVPLPGGASVPAAEKRATAEAPKSYFPNISLLTQDGEPVRFYDDLVKGKVVLINFMFTTCAGVCSPMTANLSKVQKYLGESVGREVVMLSISVDPATDTPDVLKKYAQTFKAPRGWYFLTGRKENVDAVLAKLGGYTEDKMRHSSVLIIGDEAAGAWMKTHAMSKPAEIAEAVRRLIASREKAGADASAVKAR
jgi:protein SCO1